MNVNNNAPTGKPETGKCSNLVFAGPAGVGKSTVAKLLAPRVKMVHLDFDDLRQEYSDDPDFQPSTLKLVRCLPTLCRRAPGGFILDLGGGTLFRPSTDNRARMADLQAFKAACAAGVVLLTATKGVLFERYMKGKQSTPDGFEGDWTRWTQCGAPNWEYCADIALDTSLLSPSRVATEIALRLWGYLDAGRLAIGTG